MKHDYKIGYGKPPEATRFGVRPQPNRSLKRRTAKNAAVDVVGEINRPLTITQNGAAVRMHPHEAMMHGLAKAALRGGIRAMKEFFSQCKKAGLLDAPLAQQTTGVLTVPKGIAMELAVRLVKIAGPPPWDNELYDCCKAEYDSDCANIQRLLEEERARRDEKAR